MPKNCLSYPVEIVEDLFGESTVLADFVKGRKILLVTDLNVVQRTDGLGTKIGSYVRRHGLELVGAPVVMAGGERVKMDNFQSVSRVIDAALTAGLTQEDYIIALGGGTILDVTGWAAAQLKGGVGLIRMPTTPAAMLGCAFATTAALNTQKVKDALVVDSTPKAVIFDIAFAATVLDGVWRAGLSEAVRLAAAYDIKLLTKIIPLAEAFQKREIKALSEIIELSLPLRKKKGYTEYALAPAAKLEPQSGWKLPHGYAVAIGILMEMTREVTEGTKKEKDLEVCRQALALCGALDGARHSRHLPGVAQFFPDVI